MTAPGHRLAPPRFMSTADASRRLVPGDPVEFPRSGQIVTGILSHLTHRKKYPEVELSSLVEIAHVAVMGEGIVEVVASCVTRLVENGESLVEWQPVATVGATGTQGGEHYRAFMDPPAGPPKPDMSATVIVDRSGAIKTDQGKLTWSLGNLSMFQPMVEVMHQSAEPGGKYKPHNWRGLKPERLQSAFLRHLAAHDAAIMGMWEEGLIDNDGVLTRKAVDRIIEEFKGNTTEFLKQYLADEESGLFHIDHAMTTMAMYRANLVWGTLRELPECSRAQTDQLAA